jgi:hypothetical protein
MKSDPLILRGFLFFMNLGKKIFEPQLFVYQCFIKINKKNRFGGTAFGIQGFVTANERDNSEIKQTSIHPKWQLLFFF